MVNPLITKCDGSGGIQMVDWDPDDLITVNGKPYPGASVCIYCSYGVLLARGSVHKAVSQAGFEGTAGKLRTHWVKREFDHAGPGDDIVSMAYTKGELGKKQDV